MLFGRTDRRRGWAGAEPRRGWAGRRGALAAAVALPLLLAACGEEEQAPATPAATAVVSAATAETPPMAVGSPGAGSPTAATEAPRTLGELADRVDVAWAGVRTFRSVFTTDRAGPPASPTGSPAGPSVAGTGRVKVTREVALPDRQRQTERVDGAVVSEAVVVADRAYVRGAAARTLRPGTDDATWVEIDLAAIGRAAATDPLLGRLAAPIASPAAAIPPNLRPQELRPLGGIDIAGRACQAYGAAGTTEIGGRIDLTFAVDAEGLPCIVETRAGGVTARETFEAYGLPLTIEVPATALPVASPAATPTGRD